MSKNRMIVMGCLMALCLNVLAADEMIADENTFAAETTERTESANQVKAGKDEQQGKQKQQEKRKCITIFTIGDSTMADKATDNEKQERGWAMMLQGFFPKGVEVDNHALNGYSSKSFIDKGKWQAVLDKLKPGDYVIIQFGHNDEKSNPDRHTDPGTTFDDNLRRFVDETRAKGAIPILMNSIVRRKFHQDKNAVAADDNRVSQLRRAAEGDTLIDTHGAYLISPRRVAEEKGVVFVDANRITHDLIQPMGPEDSKRLFMWIEPGKYKAYAQGRQDDTHLNVFGARTICRALIAAVCEKVPRLKRRYDDFDLVVSQEGRGEYFDLQEAVNSVPIGKKCRILVADGDFGKIKKPKGSKVKVVRRKK